MNNVTINKTNVTKLLEEKFSRLGNGWITLLQIPIQNSMEINIEAIRTLQTMGYEGVYITLSKDYVELSKLLKEGGIDMGKLAFVDGISQMYGMGKVKAPNVNYVEGPLSIDSIVESITEIIPKMKSNKKFVFLDSITTVLLYNSLERTLKFSNFLTVSLKKMGVVGIVVSVSKGFANEALIRELTKVSNEVINLQ